MIDLHEFFHVSIEDFHLLFRFSMPVRGTSSDSNARVNMISSSKLGVIIHDWYL